MTAPDWLSLTRTAERELTERLSLQAIPLPQDFASHTGSFKGSPVTIETHAYVGPRVRYARFATVEGANLQIGNLLCLPAPTYPAAILGADLVAVRRDTAMVALDLSPTTRAEAVHRTLLARLTALASEISLPPGGDLPDWCLRWFSPHPLYTRGTAEELQHAPDAIHRYLALFTDLLTTASSSPNTETTVLATQSGYMASHREDDRGLNLLAAMFSHDWAQPYVDSVLFPTTIPPPSPNPTT